MKCKVHVHLGLHLYGLTIYLKRLILPCLHCVECGFSQHLRPLTDAKVFYVPGGGDRCDQHDPPFDMGTLRL